jgi:hypothetical protein
MTSPNDAEPEYLSTFCPILSHAVLSPAVLQKDTSPKQVLLPLAGEVKKATEEPHSAEYIGCQGPSCAFFLRNEGKCAIPLLTQAAGVLIGMQMAGKVPTSQH